MFGLPWGPRFALSNRALGDYESWMDCKSSRASANLDTHVYIVNTAFNAEYHVPDS